MRQLWKGSAGLVGCLFASALLFWPQSADARSDGVLDFGCTGCHGTADIDVELTLEPEVFDPGDTVTLELRVSGASGESFGFFLGVSNGALVSTAGARGTDTDITHSTPVGFDGTGTFSVAWESPEEPGPTRFDLAAVIANGNGTRNGDHAREVTIQRVFGCPPQTFYRDVDDDGFGNPDSTVLDCAGTAPFGAASNPDDCDDFDNDRFPGATEQCNRVDDDCDGDVDEDSETVTLYPDGDGDGFYGIEEANSGTPIEGCLEPGFAALGGDCAPDDPTRNPGAEEVCNTLDDDCDAFIDERVRPVCGVGWCRRQASDCDGLICTPGEPEEEVCNGIDDDCDGETDESGCPEGATCVDATCVSDGSTPPEDPSAPTPANGCASAPPTVLGVMLGLYVIGRRRRRQTGTKLPKNQRFSRT